MDYSSDKETSGLRAGRRVTSRLRVRLPARLITLRGTKSVVLEDLSYFGARITVDDPPALGAEAVLQWGKFEAFGTVAWNKTRSMGLTFLDPIGPEILIATRDLDDGERLVGDKELQRRAARAWATGSGK